MKKKVCCEELYIRTNHFKHLLNPVWNLVSQGQHSPPPPKKMILENKFCNDFI